MKITRKITLPLTVFLTGAAVLVVEIIATRILSPYFGNTMYTVSSVISVILAALSVGYYIGGRLADKFPFDRLFYAIICISGIAVLLFYTAGTFILPFFSNAFPLALGSLLSSLILFFVPAFLLGMLSPYAVALQQIAHPEFGIGGNAGSMFFWSTLGSIAGSLMTGFIFIPHIGIHAIMVCTGGFLFFMGIVGFFVAGGKVKYVNTLFIVFAIVFSLAYSSKGNAPGLLYADDGMYEQIMIYDTQYNNRPIRVFQQDRSNSSAMFLDTQDPTDLTRNYFYYYKLGHILVPNIKQALVIGSAGYSIPKGLLFEFPKAKVDVVDIEPKLEELGKKYFNVPDTALLQSYTADGRLFLRNTPIKYDLIFSDVYNTLLSVPVQFTTVEFFTIAKNALAPDGIFIANIAGSLYGPESAFMMAEMNTFRQVFPNSYFFAADGVAVSNPQNIIFVGMQGSNNIDFASDAIVKHSDLFIRTLKEHLIDVSQFKFSEHLILTDNFAPIEFMATKLLRHKNNLQTFSR